MPTKVPEAVVVPGADGKSFRLLLGGREIGTSKTQFDADFHKNTINDAMIKAYDLGWAEAKENV